MKGQSQTPDEKQTGLRPNIGSLHVFGCHAFAWVPPGKRRKLDERCRLGIYLGPATPLRGHRLWDPVTRTTWTATSVLFDETAFGIPELNAKLKQLGLGQAEIHTDEEEEEEEREQIVPILIGNQSVPSQPSSEGSPADEIFDPFDVPLEYETHEDMEQQQLLPAKPAEPAEPAKPANRTIRTQRATEEKHKEQGPTRAPSPERPLLEPTKRESFLLSVPKARQNRRPNGTRHGSKSRGRTLRCPDPKTLPAGNGEPGNLDATDGKGNESP
jgi:hypothetical protein